MTQKDYSYLNEEKIEGEEIFDGKVVHLVRDKVRLPNGHEGIREVIRHVGAVCVIPLFENGDVIVERQFRYPHAKVLLEIPAGKLDSKEEIPLEAAKRELFEETGYTAGKMTLLGELYTTPAFVDEVIWMYLAEDLHSADNKQHLDEDEFLTVERIPLDTLCDMVMRGEIPDAKTQVAILKAKRIADENKR
ncbi:MAG: NUDIX hydrolase [Clostridia bacterium]|nr:NUDIX hydrolase [Clostridia bacterium]